MAAALFDPNGQLGPNAQLLTEVCKLVEGSKNACARVTCMAYQKILAYILT